MLSFFLKLLSVLGIILLILLGIFLVMIIIVLFVPITYKAEGQITEEKKYISIKACWLFGLVRFRLEYVETLKYQLKILWFDLTNKNTKKCKPYKKKLNKKQSDNSASEPTVEADCTNTSPTDSGEITANTACAESQEDLNLGFDDTPEKKTDTENNKTEKIIFKIRSVYAKIRKIVDKILYYFDIAAEAETKQFITHSVKTICRILKSIRPRHLSLDLTFGFETPDQTGKVYGLLCMLYPCYGTGIRIRPDFENKLLIGKASCKGRIFICTLMVNALRILLDRKLYLFIRKLKNGRNVK